MSPVFPRGAVELKDCTKLNQLNRRSGLEIAIPV
jgi:hypothetical protein